MGRETEDQDQSQDVEEEEDVEEGQDQNQDDASQEDDAGESEMDLPTALTKLEEVSRKLRETNRESAGRRRKIKELEDQLKGFTEGGDDNAKKLAKAQTDLQAAVDKLRMYDLRDKFEQAAVKGKVIWANPTAGKDAFTFAQAEIAKLGDDATEDDFLDVVKDVVKTRPYLLNKPGAKNINSEEKGKTDVFSNLNLDEIGRDFGISS